MGLESIDVEDSRVIEEGIEMEMSRESRTLQIKRKNSELWSSNGDGNNSNNNDGNDDNPSGNFPDIKSRTWTIAMGIILLFWIM